VCVLDSLGEPIFDNAKLPPVLQDSKRISLFYQEFVVALQNKVMTRFPLQYSKDLPVKNKKNVRVYTLYQFLLKDWVW